MERQDYDKRPHYFPGQYLLEDDFELEQNYHIDRQRRHNRLLHVSGIADGLIVTVFEKDLNVKISAGTAIDKDGRQIVWSAAMAQNPVNLQDVNNIATNSSYILSIGYSEEEKEPQDGATNGNRRWYETPKFELTVVSDENKRPTLPDGFIALAKLKVDGQQKVTVDDSGKSVREYSGLQLPSPDSGGLTLRSEGDKASNLAVLSGSLSVQGSLSVTGNVGIGTTTAPSNKLQIESGELSVKANNNNEATDIGAFWASDQSQGIGIRCNSIQAIGNNPNQNINLSPKGQGIVQVNGGLSVTGAVNFPQTFGQKLTLWSSDYGIGLQGSTQYFRTYQNFAWYKRGSHNDDSLNPGGGTVQMVIKNGDVGIGTTSPGEKLEVAGNIKITGTRLKNSEGLGIIETNAKDCLRVNPDENYPAIALYKPVAIGSGGLAVGDWTTPEQGVLKVTNSAYLATSAGNVGIGTTTTNAKLEVKLAEATTDASLKLEHNGSNFIVRPFSAGGTSSAIENTGGGSLLINPNGGKVGIGTKSEPVARLHVDPNRPDGGGIAIGNPNIYSSEKYTSLYLTISAEKDGYGGIQAFKSGVTGLGNLILNEQGGNVGIGTLNPSYRLNVDPNGTGGILIGNPDTTKDGYTSLSLSISDKKSGYGEIQVIHSSGGDYGDLILNPAGGNVGIGTSNPSYRLYVLGDVATNTKVLSSDIRWKQNIETIASALDKVLQLRGVSFEWRTEEYQEMNFNPGKHLGLIAQEVEKVIPEVVHQNDEGYKSLAYSNLVALLIEALKELQAKHENLLPTMQAQQAEIEGLRAELNRLRVSLIQPA